MTEPRYRDARLIICGIHKIEFEGMSCPDCLAKIRADYEALKQIPYRLKARRPGALYPLQKPRRVSY